jgi:diguanylate cyclase (GGDEF)-like protein/PAS domain S-box-containing protein
MRLVASWLVDLDHSQAFRALFENEHLVLLLVDPSDGGIVDANPAAERFYGWPRATMRTKRLPDLTARSDGDPLAGAAHATPGERPVMDVRHRLADGSVRTVRVTSGPVELDGRHLRFALVEDVTDRVRTQELLRLRDHALDVADSALVLTDLGGRILWCNPAFTRLTGFGPDEAMGSRPGDLVRSGLQDDAFYAELWDTITAGRTWRGELVNRRKDGSLYHEEMTITPVRGEHGEVRNYVAVKHDVTDRKRREADLARWRQIFDAMSVGVALSDADGARLALANPAYARLHGTSPDALVGRPILELFDATDRGLVADRLAEAERAGSTTYEVRRRRPDGTTVETATTVTRVDPDSPLDARFIATVQDIGRVRETEARLRTEQVRNRLAMEAASFGTWTLDLTSGAFDVSDAWKRHFGYRPDELADDVSVDGFGRLLHPDDSERALRELSSFLNGPRGAYHNEFRMVTRGGEVRRVLSRATVEHGEDGRAVAVHGVDVDVTELRELSEQVDRLTFFDPLTGLPNRNGALRALERMLSGRATTSPLALAVLGLDGFRAINESLGQAAGDEVLRTFASRLGSRSGGWTLLGRYGGDHFVVASSAWRASEDLDADVRAMQLELAAPFETNGLSLQLSCCLGVAIGPHDGRTATELLTHAESAMYAAKEIGPGTVRYYAHQLDHLAAERLALRAALATALAEERITVAFQPQASLRRPGVFGVEALARWTHPEWGPVAPDRFVVEAERSGQIRALGRAVRRQALSHLAAWRERGPICAHVAINVSARELDDPEWPGEVLADVEAAGLEPSALEIEITETTAMTARPEILASLEGLREAGVRVAIDDFGTGYASLGQLQRLPADLLKIDRTFVDTLTGDANERDRELVRAMVRLADAFALETLAEGVETEDQRAFLEGVGCHAVQGWLIARPMGAEAMEAYLREHCCQDGS